MELIPPSDGFGLHIAAQGCRKRRLLYYMYTSQKKMEIVLRKKRKKQERGRSKAHALGDPMSQQIIFNPFAIQIIASEIQP